MPLPFFEVLHVPDMSLTLTPSTLQELYRDATTSRFLSAAGLVVLLYDHLLTLPDEISLIWRSPPSFSKYAFLLNRYLVPIVLIAIAFEMSGLSGLEFTTNRCQFLLASACFLGIISIGIANILVLLQVVILWDRNITVVILLSIGFVASFSATFSFMTITVIKLYDSIEYNEMADMCWATKTTPTLIAVWASPMLFEILVLLSTCWNVFDRPRISELHFVKALHHDGIVFFVSLTILRALNMSLAAFHKASLVMLAIFFVWAMTTLVLSRFILNVRRAEVKQALSHPGSILGSYHTASPFGRLPVQLDDWEFEGDMREGEVYWKDLSAKQSSGSPINIELERLSKVSSQW